jgi:hypothetical protein
MTKVKVLSCQDDLASGSDMDKLNTTIHGINIEMLVSAYQALITHIVE